MKRRIARLTRFRSAGLAFAFVGVELALAQADGLGRDLNQLVVVDVGDGLLQRELARRGQADRLVVAGGAEVVSCLALSG